MKQIFQKLLLLTIVGSIGLLYSCSDDDETPPAAPSLSVSAAIDGGGSLSDGGDVGTGETVTFTVTITAPGGFNTLNVSNGLTATYNRNSQEAEVSEDGTSATVTFSAETPSQAGSITVDFEAVDDDNQTTTDSFSFNVTSPAAKVQTAIILFAPGGEGKTHTFYSISEDMVYSIDDVDATTDPVSGTIDLGYYYGQEANLVSPSVYVSFTGLGDTQYGDANDGLPAWGTRNETKLAETTLTDVTEITTVADVEGAISGIDFTAAGNVMEGLAVGEIYAFETAGGLQGLIRVLSILEGFQVGTDPNDSEVTGNVELEFILAEAAE